MKGFGVSLFLLFVSCTMTPELKKIDYPVPDRLPKTHGPGVRTLEDDKMKNLSWREFYRTKELRSLIAESLTKNRELRASILLAEEVRAQYGIQKSRLYPEVNVSAGMTRMKIPENAFISRGGGAGGALGRATEGFIQEQYSLEVGITSYELDLFGKIRSLNEAALQEYLAAETTRESATILLMAQVADTYQRYLAAQELHGLALKTFDSQEKSLELVRGRFSAGISSELDLRQAESLLEGARADMAGAQRELALAKHSLELLVGRSLDKSELKGSFEDALNGLGEVPVNLRSTVLLKRPDVRRAEHQLLAANANIGAARAAFFPSLSLTTSVGKLSTETSNLFDRDSNTWLFMPQLNLPIFTGGRNRALFELAQLRKDRRIVEYEGAIQGAFREVSDALVSSEGLFEELKAREKMVNSAERALELSRKRYLSGIENYLTVLVATRSYYLARRAWINQKLAYFMNLNFLFRALGGGLPRK